MKKLPVILLVLLAASACGGGNPGDQYETDTTDSRTMQPASGDTSSSTGGDTTMYQRESNKTSDSTQK